MYKHIRLLQDYKGEKVVNGHYSIETFPAGSVFRCIYEDEESIVCVSGDDVIEFSRAVVLFEEVST